jgi:protocatechuate 3,4-dioxygenase beta subunit
MIAGTVEVEGRPVVARIEVRRRLANPRHPHGFYRTAESTERFLLAPDPEAGPAASTTSDAQGRFVVRGLPPARYDVLARSADGAWAAVRVPLDADGQRMDVSLHPAPATERLKGRLHHADGRPVRGLVVVSRAQLAVPDDDTVQEASERWGETDADGRFDLDGLATGEVHVSALLPGRYFRNLGTLTLPAPGGFEAVVDAGGGHTPGRVLDIETDLPLEGARVVWYAWLNPGRCCGVETTGADGSFHLPVPDGRTQLQVQKRGFAPWYRENMGASWDVVRLRRGSTIRGRVVGPDGRTPVSGLTVERRGPGSYWYQWSRATTDGEGRFVLEDLAPGEGALYARGGGWIPAGLREPRPFAWSNSFPKPDPNSWTVEPASTLDVELHVERGATLTGRVLDPAGRPAAAVPIFVKHDDDPEFEWTGQELPALAATGEDGAFRIEGLLPGATYELVARPQGGVPLTGEAVTRLAEEATEPLVLRPWWLDVVVVDAKTQQPLPDARVQVRVKGNIEERTWRTAPSGRARVGPLSAHDGRLVVGADGYLDADDEPEANATGAREPITVALDPALTLSGRVVHADETPAGDAVVDIGSEGSGRRGASLEHVPCRADGTFAVKVTDIDYRLRVVLVRGRERLTAEADVHGADHDVTLTLRPDPEAEPAAPPPAGEPEPVPLVLRVLDGAGRPVPTFQLSPQHDGAASADGAVRFSPPPDRDGPLKIWGAAAADGVALPLGPLDLERWPEGKPDAVTVVLPPERVLEGKTVDLEGKPVGRVTLTAIPAAEFERDFNGGNGPVHGSAASRADGTFRLGGLGDLRYRLVVEPQEGWLAPRERVEARPGAPLVITLRPAADAVVLVRLQDGRPVPGAVVTASRGGWHYLWRDGWEWRDLFAAVARTDAEGRAFLPGLDPERRHRLSVASDEGARLSFREEREDWLPAPNTVTILPLGVVRGVVEAPAHVSSWDQHILWRSAGGRWRHPFARPTPTIQESGEFEIVVPAEGTVELIAGPYLLRGPLATTRIVRAKAGDTGVTLPFESGVGLIARCEEVVEWGLMEDGTPGPNVERLVTGDGQGAEHVFTGLDPAKRYTVTAIAGDRFGRVSGVAPGGDAVVVPLAPGRTLTVRVKASGPSAQSSCGLSKAGSRCTASRTTTRSCSAGCPRGAGS